MKGALIAYGGAAIVLGVVAWYLVKKVDGAAPTVEEIKEALDPTSDQNLAYKAVNALARPFIGEHDTVGSWFARKKSDEAGAAATAPVSLLQIKDNYVGDFALDTGLRPGSLVMDNYVGDFALATDRAIVDGAGGAAFGLYPNAFRSK